MTPPLRAGAGPYNQGVRQIRELIRGAKSITVLTGAGISAESGIPTFRGQGGLWREFRAEDLATPQAFARDPKLVWEWYDWRRSLIAQAQPNPGHFALAELESRTPTFTLVTQNVDGLHDRAGNRNILKVHGDIWTLRCVTCRREWQDLRPNLPELPPCCECGGLARPGVVWFGEMLPEGVWQRAEDAAARAEVLLVIGTSAVVYPAASLISFAQESGAKVVEINIARTPLTARIDYSLRGPSGELLPQLVG